MLQAAAGHLNEEHCVYHASHGARRTVSWYDPWRWIFIFFSAIVTLILVHSLTRFTFYSHRNDQQSKKCDVYPGGRDDPPWPPPPLRYRAEQRLLGGLTPAVPLRATGLLGPDPGAAPVLHRARLAPGADAEEGQQAAVAHWIRRVSYEHFVYFIAERGGTCFYWVYVQQKIHGDCPALGFPVLKPSSHVQCDRSLSSSLLQQSRSWRVWPSSSA